MKWKKYILFAGIGIVVYAGMRYLLPAAIPFLLGWLLASMVLPAAIWIEKHLRIRRGIAGGVLIGVFAVILGWGAWEFVGLLAEQGRELLEKAGILAEQAQEYLEHCCSLVAQFTGIGEGDVREFLVYHVGKIQEEVQKKADTAWLGYAVTMTKGIVALVGGMVIAILFGTLLVKDLEEIRGWMAAGRVRRKIQNIGQKICRAGGRYIKAQFLIMSLVALVCIGGFWILKNPYFVVAGLLVGLLDALPLIGVGTILIPWAILWCIQGEYITGLGYFILFLAANLTRQFAEPRIVGREMGMHPALLLISVYGGFFVYGFPGFLLGPITVLILQAVWMELNTGDQIKNR